MRCGFKGLCTVRLVHQEPVRLGFLVPVITGTLSGTPRRVNKEVA